MIIARVTGSVWATKKDERLDGLKLMQVLRLDGDSVPFVAADSVGAGIGDTVLITTGSSARAAVRDKNTPVDAVIVGVIDNL